MIWMYVYLNTAIQAEKNYCIFFCDETYASKRPFVSDRKINQLIILFICSFSFYFANL